MEHTPVFSSPVADERELAVVVHSNLSSGHDISHGCHCRVSKVTASSFAFRGEGRGEKEEKYKFIHTGGDKAKRCSEVTLNMLNCLASVLTTEAHMRINTSIRKCTTHIMNL